MSSGQWFSDAVNAVAQWLIGAPLWVQTPLVLGAALGVCALAATCWLWVVDRAGALTYPLFHSGGRLGPRGRARSLPLSLRYRRAATAGKRNGGVIVVESTDPH